MTSKEAKARKNIKLNTTGICLPVAALQKCFANSGAKICPVTGCIFVSILDESL